jgi:hypothetical protein
MKKINFSLEIACEGLKVMDEAERPAMIRK